jgi:hypothetical protein
MVYLYHGLPFLYRGRNRGRHEARLAKVFLRLDHDHTRLVPYANSTCLEKLRLSKYMHNYINVESEPIAPRSRESRKKECDTFTGLREENEHTNAIWMQSENGSSDFSLTMVGKAGEEGVEMETAVIHRIWVKWLGILLEEQALGVSSGDGQEGTEQIPTWLLMYA